MASAFETALTALQADVVEKVGEATPYVIGIAAAFAVGIKLVKRITKSVL